MIYQNEYGYIWIDISVKNIKSLMFKMSTNLDQDENLVHLRVHFLNQWARYLLQQLKRETFT